VDAQEARIAKTQFAFGDRTVEHFSRKWSATMKNLSKVLVASGFVLGLASASTLAGGIVTRSVEDANADLMRTYKTYGGQPAGTVRARSAEDANADLTRDWNAKASNAGGAPVQARNSVDAYIDLMRLSFGFGQPVN
jgi:hypothetical protein